MPFDRSPPEEHGDDDDSDDFAVAVLIVFICAAEAEGLAFGELSATRALCALSRLTNLSVAELREIRQGQDLDD